MPHSSISSPEEDVELPDAPQTPTDESGPDSPPPKSEPHSDAADLSSAPTMKEEEEDKKTKLENIFADGSDEDFFDDDDDGADLLESSAPVAPEKPTIPNTTIPEPAHNPTDVKPISRPAESSIMLIFYQRLFPFRDLFNWLNHSPKPSNDFGHREFAFTLQNDAYLRYQAFPTSETLRKEILRLNPSRFEIGPVYSANPRDRKVISKSAFRPLSKELVFDIDLTDYDEIRTCCDKANICIKCWQFITVAIKIMDSALRDDLGFRHILWVYSGRRGAHAWVCDKRARDLDDSKRRAVASYLELIRGGSEAGKKVNLKRPLHPHVVRSLDILKERFKRDILKDQDPWRDIKDAEKLLALLPDQALNNALRKKWESDDNRASMLKWGDIDKLAETAGPKLNTKQLMEYKQDVVLEYMYPRLDVEVSKHLNHLLKSPFCVHPGTGRVCVPIDSQNPEEFDPMAVPTVTELLAEIDMWEKENGRGEKIQGMHIPVLCKGGLSY